MLLAGAGAVSAAAAGGTWSALRSEGPPAPPGAVAASSDAVRHAERVRRERGTGRTVRAALTPEPAEVDLGGRVVRTWAYGAQVPGAVVRCRAGDLLEVDVRNRLPEPTTVHWHGLRIRNDMDGVPHLTQSAVGAGEGMRYSFTVPDAGTYWLHPHVGLQRERGLYAPLVVDDPHEAGDYDAEFVVVLDDWIDGAGATPARVLDTLRDGGMEARYRTSVEAGRIPDRATEDWQYRVPKAVANSPAGAAAKSVPERLAGSVDYPFHLLNGRLPTAPRTFRAKPGRRVRIRLVNAGGTTAYRVALGGHRLTVTHTDGFPVEPVTVDTLQVASGERYDLLVTLGDGAFPLVAAAEGKGAQAFAVVRTAGGRAPSPTAVPRELAGRLLDLSDLRAAPAVRAGEQPPDVQHTVYLTGDMREFGWRINAEAYRPDRPFKGITPLPVRQGEQVRLVFVNQTPMYHPMHLHGHTFTVRAIGDSVGRAERSLPAGTRKDTLMVPPGQRIAVDLAADNPGQWLVHCHNTYHLATGMATVVSYRQV